MAYLHQNYPPFCNDIEECANLMEYTSIADAIMRMEGDNVSWRYAARAHYLRNTSDAKRATESTVFAPCINFALFFPSVCTRCPHVAPFSDTATRTENVQKRAVGNTAESAR